MAKSRNFLLYMQTYRVNSQTYVCSAGYLGRLRAARHVSCYCGSHRIRNSRDNAKTYSLSDLKEAEGRELTLLGQITVNKLTGLKSIQVSEYTH